MNEVGLRAFYGLAWNHFPELPSLSNYEFLQYSPFKKSPLIDIASQELHVLRFVHLAHWRLKEYQVHIDLAEGSRILLEGGTLGDFWRAAQT